jgi:hypothetical protein
MAEIRERRTVIHDIPLERPPVVKSEDLKARAEKLAMSVEGVRRVINNITVQP